MHANNLLDSLRLRPSTPQPRARLRRARKQQLLQLARYREGFSVTAPSETAMNEDTFNISIRKFLKMVGVSSQREIEHSVGAAIQHGQIAGNESLPARMTLEIEGVQLRVAFDGVIELE
jgi:hypothetical protein|nr:DUF6494 family protein [uncultured Steroidobacter sp.]